MDLWECDGCGLTGTVEEVETHIRQTNTLPNGDMKEPADIICWGAMGVGSQAWNQYHFEGVHPMATLMNEIVPKYLDLIVNGDEDGA